MVPTLACILIFGGFGAFRAWRGKGKGLDIAHYAASHALMGLIVGVLLAIVLSRYL